MSHAVSSIGSTIAKVGGALIDPIGSAIGAVGNRVSPGLGSVAGIGGAAQTVGDLLGGQPQGNSFDPNASAAQRDWEQNQQALAQQTWANRPTVNTPWGTQSWQSSQQIDPATGKPVTAWTQNTTLSPEQQQAFDAQQNIQAGRSGAAQTLLGQATDAFSKPFDWNNLPPAQMQAAQAGNVQDAQQRAYANMSQMLQPGRTQQQDALDTKLANMGLSSGSEANRRSNMQLSDQWGAQDRQMMGQAMQQGTSDVQSQYGMDSAQIAQAQALRQNAIAEQGQQRSMPLNELNALLSGQQVGMPQMPGFNAAGSGQPAENLQAQGMQNQMNLASQPDWGSLLGSGLGAAGMFAMM